MIVVRYNKTTKNKLIFNIFCPIFCFLSLKVFKSRTRVGVFPPKYILDVYCLKGAFNQVNFSKYKLQRIAVNNYNSVTHRLLFSNFTSIILSIIQANSFLALNNPFNWIKQYKGKLS